MLLFLPCAGNVSQANAVSKVEEKFPGLAMDVLKSARLVSMPLEILLKSEVIEIRASDLDKILEQMPADMRKQWAQNLFFLLEQEAGKKILVRQAALAGVSLDGRTDMETIQTFLKQKTDDVSVTDAEVQTFYDANKEMVGGMPLEQVKESIKDFMLNQKKQDVIDDYLSTLGETAEIQVNHDWADSQDKIVKNNPVDKARNSGKPTMAEFGATGCIPCDMMQPILDKLRKQYGDRLNVVFAHVRENPILGARFGIRAIPVQVFYDKDGKEVFRHTGFYAEAEVLKQIEKLGVK
jgi:thioredoxin 1